MNSCLVLENQNEHWLRGELEAMVVFISHRIYGIRSHLQQVREEAKSRMKLSTAASLDSISDGQKWEEARLNVEIHACKNSCLQPTRQKLSTFLIFVLSRVSK